MQILLFLGSVRLLIILLVKGGAPASKELMQKKLTRVELLCHFIFITNRGRKLSLYFISVNCIN